MPYCTACGNRRLFASSRVPPAVATANGPVSGIMASFSPDGEIETMTRTGVDKQTTRLASANPREYFDICPLCGNAVAWEDGEGS